MYSFIVIGDPHIKIKYLKDATKFVDDTTDIIKKHLEEINFVVILGDILDTHGKIEVDCLNLAIKFIKTIAISIDVFVIIGNHDMANPTEVFTKRHPFNALVNQQNIHIIDTIKRYGDVIFTPYMPPECFINALNDFGEWENADLIFSHIEVKDFFICAGIKSTNGCIWLNHYPQLISGHLHSYQNVGNVFYPGSPYKHTFNSSEKCKGIFRCNFDEELTIFEIKMNIPDKKLILIKINEINNFIENYNNIDNYKIILYGKNTEILDFKKSITYEDLCSRGNIKYVIFNNIDNSTFKMNDNCKEINFIDIFYSNIVSTNNKKLLDIFKLIT